MPLYANAAILCESLPNPDNGYIQFTEISSDAFNFQTTATYVCNDGYGLSGGDINRTCVGSENGPGEWTGTAPTCEGKEKYSFSINFQDSLYLRMFILIGIVCSALTPPVNFGRVSYFPDTTDPFDVGTVATYSCITNFGYGLTGDPTRTCVDGDRLNTTGVWNGVAPTCDCEF